MVKKVIIVILVSLLVMSTTMVLYINFSHNWKPKPYDKTYLQVAETDINVSKDEARSVIKELFKTFHFYKEKEIGNGAYGRSLILFRTITVDPYLDIEDYIFAYAHELCHIKYWCQNETWTNYKTFVTLYESEIDVMRYVALVYARDILMGNYEDTPYDCGYYILKYLEDKQC